MNAIVTGGNRGIGFAVAKQLAERGFRVTLLARDREAGARAARDLTAGFVVGDLSSVRSTSEAAAALLAACPSIDVLVHNAGLWPTRMERNEDGLERAFAVNHLAPFLLNHLLEERLVASRGRVVQVSAGLYVAGRFDVERTPPGDDFHPIRTYASTKLGNLLTLKLFAQRWQEQAVTINAVHPGVIRTGLGDRRGILGVLLRGVKLTWKSPDTGARPVVRLATESSGTGKYFHLQREMELGPVARDEALALRLWEKSRKLAGLDGAQAVAR